jgi:3-methyladenine DNA glycosylase AlkC
MPTPLKELYSKSFYTQFAFIAKELHAEFDSIGFAHEVMSNGFEDLELKERMARTSITAKKYLPEDFKQTTRLFMNLFDRLKGDPWTDLTLPYMFVPDYIARYGMDDFETSVETMEYVTQFTSCEFAVRPFLIEYPKRMLDKMIEWSTHDNHHVRRLASEGCRPRLPWAMALPAYKKDPVPILPILEILKNDPSEYVRRSVANNINDIAKDNEAMVIDIAKRWLGQTAETDALVKHACRTLLKNGHPEILPLFGLDASAIEIDEFNVNTPMVQMGDRLSLDFEFRYKKPGQHNVRIEYAIYHLKKNGELTKKVFKVSEREIEGNQWIAISREHHFKPITTRVYYAGKHEVSVILNGKEFERKAFELIL